MIIIGAKRDSQVSVGYRRFQIGFVSVEYDRFIL